MANCPNCGTPLPPDSQTCPTCAQRAAPALPPPVPRGGAKTRWGLIVAVGCAAMIPILGIIAAIAIPNFVSAVAQSKTKRTIAELRTIGVAIESYRVDHDSAPEADSLAALAAFLEPDYLTAMPSVDGWQRELRYQCWSEQGESGCDSYRLASAGKDGVFEQEDLSAYGQEETGWRDYDRDIVFGDGQFYQVPGNTR